MKSPIELERKLTPLELKVLRKFLSFATAIPSVVRIFLYGSRSEMFSTEWSDIDLAVVVMDKKRLREVEKKIEFWIIDSSPEVLIHPLVIDEESLESKGIGRKIQEGDLLWQRK